MNTVHEGETTFQALPLGRAFRFDHDGQSVIGLKAQFSWGNRGLAALVLTPTKEEAEPRETKAERALRPGDLIAGELMGHVFELAGVKIVPSRKPMTVRPGAGDTGRPGEIELRAGGSVFVTQPQDGDLGQMLRVYILSGAVSVSVGAPVEIYSEWSVVRGGEELLYEHKWVPVEDDLLLRPS